MSLVFALLLALPLAQSSAAQGPRDRPAQIRPMNEILSVVQSRYPGRVMDVDIDGRGVYRVKMMTGSGQLMVVAVDGRTARILSVRGGRGRR